MRLFFRSDYRSLYLLNATQFLGALNDNIFKLLIIFLLINLQGAEYANSILAYAGFWFVVPFLLFSSAAGVMADRISKRPIIVAMKVVETVIMALAVWAIYKQSALFCYILLFCMGMQSAIFGPSKYGIIPELVDSRKVSKANGLLSAFTYLAIILGTFLASFITKITSKNFTIASSFCVVVAILGFFTSLGIKKTPAKGTKKLINPFFPYEIYQSLKISYEVPHLVTAIFGAAFFLFIGAFTQLNIIPFAIQSMGLDETGGGFLFLATAIGIAMGASFAGKISKDKVEIGLSCIASFFLAIFFFLLSLCSFSLILVIINLIFLGFCGGVLLVPFDSFIQVESPDKHRGRIVAANSFLSFFGVLLAAIFIFLLGSGLDLSAKSAFTIMGILTLVFSIFISGRLAALFFPFLSQKFLLRYYALQVATPTPEKKSVLILQKGSWLDILILFSFLPNLRILRPSKYLRQFPYFNFLFNNIHRTPVKSDPDKTLSEAFKKAKKRTKADHLCLYISPGYTKKQIISHYNKTFSDQDNLQFIDVKWDTVQKVFFSSSFRQNQVTISFNKIELNDL